MTHILRGDCRISTHFERSCRVSPCRVCPRAHRHSTFPAAPPSALLLPLCVTLFYRAFTCQPPACSMLEPSWTAARCTCCPAVCPQFGFCPVVHHLLLSVQVRNLDSVQLSTTFFPQSASAIWILSSCPSHSSLSPSPNLYFLSGRPIFHMLANSAAFLPSPEW